MPRIERTFQYQEIARELRQQIVRGDFRVDGKLPSERVLGERFGVQRNTVRQALELLEREGQITTEGKRGSFIRPLSQSPRNTLLVGLHGSPSPDLSRIEEGIAAVATRGGYSVRRVDSSPSAGTAFDPVPQPEDLGEDVAGVVLWPQNPTNAEAIARLNAAVPLVLVDRRILGVSVDSVGFDDVAGGRTVTEHLLAQGHRRIAFLTDDVFAETVQNRWRGYALALEAAEVPIDNRHCLFFYGIDWPYFQVAMRHVMSIGEDSPTAIVCSNDLVAFVVLRFLRDEGIRVPTDVAVTGYGDAMPDYTSAIGLTGVEQPFAELGETAATLLLDRLTQDSDDRFRAPRDVRIPVRLVVRGSSGPHDDSPANGSGP